MSAADRLDRERLAVWLFEKSHEPSYSDDPAGMQDARDDADYLLEALGVRELQAENERLRAEVESPTTLLRIAAQAAAASEVTATDAMKALLSVSDLAAERDAAREQVRERDEVIARVRALAAAYPSVPSVHPDNIRAALDGPR